MTQDKFNQTDGDTIHEGHKRSYDGSVRKQRGTFAGRVFFRRLGLGNVRGHQNFKSLEDLFHARVTEGNFFGRDARNILLC